MTKANRDKRYAIFIRRGDTARAEELAAKYPDVKPKPVEEETKSKEKK